MNPAVLSPVRASIDLRDLQTIVGLPSHSSRVAPRVAELAQNLTIIINEMVISAIAARTLDDFKERRDRVMYDYSRALRAQSDMLSIMIPDRLVFQSLIGEAFSELERDLTEQGEQRFGMVLRDQATFTLWTLRRTIEQTWKLAAAGHPAEPDADKDRDLLTRFIQMAIWSQFHLHCLVVAIRFDKSVYPDLLPEIAEGLRGAVNAYALVREAMDLRSTQEEPIIHPYAWDEEDQELLNSSMQDLAGT